MKLKILIATLVIGFTAMAVITGTKEPKEELIEETRAFIPVMEETHEDRTTNIPDADSNIPDTSDSTDIVRTDERPTEPLPEETYYEEEVIYEEWVEPDISDSDYSDADSSDWDDSWDDYIAPETHEVVADLIPQSDTHYGFSDNDVYEIARITYLETGCLCDYYTVYLTACVIINRYLDWGYASINDVIFASGQYATAYQYTDWGGGELRINERTWSAVYDALAHTDRNPHYQMRSGAGHEVYYFDAEWDVCFYY